jgi:hypothetical protein
VCLVHKLKVCLGYYDWNHYFSGVLCKSLAETYSPSSEKGTETKRAPFLAIWSGEVRALRTKSFRDKPIMVLPLILVMMKGEDVYLNNMVVSNLVAAQVYWLSDHESRSDFKGRINSKGFIDAHVKIVQVPQLLLIQVLTPVSACSMLSLGWSYYLSLELISDLLSHILVHN